MQIADDSFYICLIYNQQLIKNPFNAREPPRRQLPLNNIERNIPIFKTFVSRSKAKNLDLFDPFLPFRAFTLKA